MVRLVFRPYTQIRRTICTSVSLRASTRVSPGFTLFRHRSPSFGSQHICYYSNLPQANDRSIVPPTRGQDSYLRGRNPLYFHCASGFATQILAYMLDPWSVFQDGWKKTISSSSRTQQVHFYSSIHLSHRQNFVLSRAWANRPQRIVLRKGRVLILIQNQCRT